MRMQIAGTALAVQMIGCESVDELQAFVDSVKLAIQNAPPGTTHITKPLDQEKRILFTVKMPKLSLSHATYAETPEHYDIYDDTRALN